LHFHSETKRFFLCPVSGRWKAYISYISQKSILLHVPSCKINSESWLSRSVQKPRYFYKYLSKQSTFGRDLTNLKVMAVVLLDNLPLPSLKSYTIGSLLLFVLATIYGYNFNNEISDNNEQSLWQIITSCMAKDPFCTWVSCDFLCWIFRIYNLIFRSLMLKFHSVQLC
jgi:hypothetical protein